MGSSSCDDFLQLSPEGNMVSFSLFCSAPVSEDYNFNSNVKQVELVPGLGPSVVIIFGEIYLLQTTRLLINCSFVTFFGIFIVIPSNSGRDRPKKTEIDFFFLF